jgi:hypothetical protein
MKKKRNLIVLNFWLLINVCLFEMNKKDLIQLSPEQKQTKLEENKQNED